MLYVDCARCVSLLRCRLGKGEEWSWASDDGVRALSSSLFPSLSLLFSVSLESRRNNNSRKPRNQKEGRKRREPKDAESST